MVPNCGLLWDEFRGGFPFIIAQAYCICDVTFLIFNKVNAHIRSLAEQLTRSSSCSRLMSRPLFTPRSRFSKHIHRNRAVVKVHLQRENALSQVKASHFALKYISI